jgi:diaminohydroxyphosphoribosylaminopyrimidine deaminase/5-amino-6-(5-phosphoribosylamino)uracil reductase
MIHSDDLSFMDMAFGLAEKGRGWASPNPCVGAVVVRRGVVVGAGWHLGPGTPHAETLALRQAGRLAQAATLYVTLEPCVHWGHTPPCVESLLKARLSRVVISSYDPNPLVFRRGVRILRQAGLDVLIGVRQEKNIPLNEAYFAFIRRQWPFVTLKAASSLDGRLATRTGDSKWISTPLARNYAHLLRAEHDALLVGIGTVLRDDPLLTVRHPLWKGKRLKRVILDTRLRFPPRARMMKTLSTGEILIFSGPDSPSARSRRLENLGAEVVRLERRGKYLSLPAVLGELGRREVAGLLVEGGSQTASNFLEARLVDKIFLTLSPKLVGGLQAPGLYGGRGAALIRRALGLKNVRSFVLDEEIFVEGYL